MDVWKSLLTSKTQNLQLSNIFIHIIHLIYIKPMET